MANILGVELAPLSIPRQRRLQTLALAFYMWIALFSLMTPLFILILLPLFWWTIPLYLIWIAYDFGRPSKGSRPWQFLRERAIWRYVADYFPMKLIKTADLDQERNYIFGYHPHGIGSVGAVINFGTEATHFSQKFPGIQRYICTLPSNFMIPLRREYLMCMGKRTKDTIQKNLRNHHSYHNVELERSLSAILR